MHFIGAVAKRCAVFASLCFLASIKEPWGSISSGISWQQYFHDASIYWLSISPMISLQVAKGFWFHVSGTLIPRGECSAISLSRGSAA